MIIDYVCEECDVREIDVKIIPEKRCPKCGCYMECIEEGEY